MSYLRNKEEIECQQGKEIDEAVKGMERLQEESRMFKTAKKLNRKRFENPFVHDENEKHLSNPEEYCKIIKDHFKRHFYKESIKSLPCLLESRKNSINQLQQKK